MGSQDINVVGAKQELVVGPLNIYGVAGIIIESPVQILLKVCGSIVSITPAGVNIIGPEVMTISTGMPAPPDPPFVPGTPAEPDQPAEAKSASPKDPINADDSVSGIRSPDENKVAGHVRETIG